MFGFAIYPTSFPRVLAEADGWAHFRVLRLKFRLHCLASTTGVQVAGYIGGVQDTGPSTVSAVSELIPSTVITSRQTTPSPWVNVSKSDLAGPFPWYKSVPGAADPTEESPGAVYIAGDGATDAFAVEFAGVMEFKVAAATANTPQEIKLIAELRLLRQKVHKEKRREDLLRVLAPPGSTGGPVQP